MYPMRYLKLPQAEPLLEDDDKDSQHDASSIASRAPEWIIRLDPEARKVIETSLVKRIDKRLSS